MYRKGFWYVDASTNSDVILFPTVKPIENLQTYLII